MTDMTDQERAYPRKVFRSRVTLSLDNKPPVERWSIDISLSGISLLLDEKIHSGQYGVIKFDMVINRRLFFFSAIAKAVYCVATDANQYRAGFQFYDLSAANASIIDALEG